MNRKYPCSDPSRMLRAMPAADDQPHRLPKFLDQYLSHQYKENRDNNNKERREGGNTYRTILLQLVIKPYREGSNAKS